MNTPHENTARHFAAKRAPRDTWQSIMRGLLMRCPSCGTGKMFGKFLKVQDSCPNCKEELHHHKADDAPAYFTILIVGHIVIGLVLSMQVAYNPPYWVHVAIWPALTTALSLFFLPRIKGALVGLQWALFMHGFDPDAPDEDEAANQAPAT